MVSHTPSGGSTTDYLYDDAVNRFRETTNAGNLASISRVVGYESWTSRMVEVYVAIGANRRKPGRAGRDTMRTSQTDEGIHAVRF
jgi:hypothetical protein